MYNWSKPTSGSGTAFGDPLDVTLTGVFVNPITIETREKTGFELTVGYGEFKAGWSGESETTQKRQINGGQWPPHYINMKVTRPANECRSWMVMWFFQEVHAGMQWGTKYEKDVGLPNGYKERWIVWEWDKAAVHGYTGVVAYVVLYKNQSPATTGPAAK
jgi:hypothetical protein